MNSAVDAVDHQIVAILRLVGEPARDQPPDDDPALGQFADMDDPVDRSALDATGGKLPLHRVDDVATLTHRSKARLQSLCQAPAPALERLGQPEGGELAQPPCP